MQWEGGLALHKYLAGVTVAASRTNKSHSLQFARDGSLRNVELKVTSLTSLTNAHCISLYWEGD